MCFVELGLWFKLTLTSAKGHCATTRRTPQSVQVRAVPKGRAHGFLQNERAHPVAMISCHDVAVLQALRLHHCVMTFCSCVKLLWYCIWKWEWNGTLCHTPSCEALKIPFKNGSPMQSASDCSLGDMVCCANPPFWVRLASHLGPWQTGCQSGFII